MLIEACPTCAEIYLRLSPVNQGGGREAVPAGMGTKTPGPDSLKGGKLELVPKSFRPWSSVPDVSQNDRRGFPIGRGVEVLNLNP